MTRKVLLFPALMLESVRIKLLAVERGEQVIAAASDAGESGLGLFTEKRILPHVLSDAFPDALLALIAQEAIEHIYCPHDRCYNEIVGLVNQKGVNVSVCNGLQQFHTDLVHGALAAVVKPVHTAYAGRAMLRPIMPLDHLVALLNSVTPIAGQSHFLKLAVLGCLAADIPDGDVVEIGLASGRSAVFLTLLMQYFRTGVFLGIDPWTREDTEQNLKGLDERLPQEQAAWERGLRVFTLNMLPYARQEVALLRKTSAEAFRDYEAERWLGAPPFGPVMTRGQIGLLHVDGNHMEAKAAEDLRLWGARVVPGGWIVVDDYVWAYGDGPKRAADGWLAAQAERVAEHFVAGGAMFIKIK